MCGSTVVWRPPTKAATRRSRTDITNLLDASGVQVLTLLAEDDPHGLAKPRSKQDGQKLPHDIGYPRATGIWQTVWFERVSRT